MSEGRKDEEKNMEKEEKGEKEKDSDMEKLDKEETKEPKINEKEDEEGKFETKKGNEENEKSLEKKEKKVTAVKLESPEESQTSSSSPGRYNKEKCLSIIYTIKGTDRIVMVVKLTVQYCCENLK